MPYIGGTGSSGGINVVNPPVDDKAITRWDGTNGRRVQNSPGTKVQDSGAIEAQGFITNKIITNEVKIEANKVMITSGFSIEAGGELIIEANGELVLV